MVMPIDALEIDPDDYKNADENVRQLAEFCSELLQALKYMFSLE